MRSGISFTLSAPDRVRLQALVADRNTPQKHVWRARIVLLSADGLGTHAIMREAGVSKTAVWRWQDRFAKEGVDGLLRDRTRPARIPPLGPEVAARVQGMAKGIQEARDTFEDNLNRLQRDYAGMERFHELARQGAVSLPVVADL